MGTRKMVVTLDLTESAYVEVDDSLSWADAQQAALAKGRELSAADFQVDEGGAPRDLYVSSEDF